MQLRAYYNYWRNRVDEHGIHSPFVFDFYNTVLLKADQVNDLAIRSLARKLKQNNQTIRVEDFGAGSKTGAGTERKISGIAKTSAMSRDYGKLLTRLVERYQLNNIVELGTSLGVGSLYLAQPPSVKKLITIEGSEEIAKIASRNFEDFGAKNVEIMIGKFDECISQVSSKMPRIDLVYIDGNHRYQPTLDYFHFFIDQVHDSSFIIFDDIYWSDGMEKAWKEICASPKINVSMDLFRLGIVCKRPGQAKQHFVLKY